MNTPETRFSLIGRLPNHEDQEAWHEFVQVYQPLIFRIARKRGLQHADAAEVTQEVLRRVAGAVSRLELDESRGSFRGWLFRIARNATIDHLRRDGRRPTSQFDSTHGGVDAIPDSGQQVSGEFDSEYRRSLMFHAASLIRTEFQERTWTAFWRSTVEGAPVADVARELGMTVGAVYIARSRVMKRLAAEVNSRNHESISW